MPKRSAQSGSHTRPITWHDGRAGIRRLPTGKRAPYWRGARAELIVSARVRTYEELKKSKRRGGGVRTKRERTPHQQLRRLERALARRKTLAARQRIAAQIKRLRKELGIVVFTGIDIEDFV